MKKILLFILAFVSIIGFTHVPKANAADLSENGLALKSGLYEIQQSNYINFQAENFPTSLFIDDFSGLIDSKENFTGSSVNQILSQLNEAYNISFNTGDFTNVESVWNQIFNTYGISQSFDRMAYIEPFSGYTISFVTNCDETIAPLTNLSVIPTDLPTPTRPGYDLDGWYITPAFAMDEVVFSGTTLTQNITIYARWMINSEDDYYTITFNCNGGTPSSYPSIEAKVYPELPIPTKEGFHFQGWQIGYDPDDRAIEGYDVHHDVTLKAIWYTNNEVLNLHLFMLHVRNPNFISNVNLSEFQQLANKIANIDTLTDSVTDSVVKKITILTNHMVSWGKDYNVQRISEREVLWREIVEFLGFTLSDIDYDGSIYIKNGDTSISVLQANGLYFNQEFRLNYHTNSDEIIDSVVVIHIPEELPVPSSRPGYLFDGWYSDYNLTTPVVSNTMLTQATDIYAKWVINPNDTYFTLTFDSNGGEDPVITSIEVEEIPTEDYWPTPLREGYIFAGWYYELEYTNLLNAGDTIGNNMTVYAKWDKIQLYYSITYNENGGTPEQTDLLEQIRLPSTLPVISKAGYQFDGWYLDSNFQTVAVANSLLGSNTTLYAKFTQYGSWMFYLPSGNELVQTFTGLEMKNQYEQLSTWPTLIIYDGFIEGFYLDILCTPHEGTGISYNFIDVYESWVLHPTQNMKIYIKAEYRLSFYYNNEKLGSYNKATINSWETLPTFDLEYDVIKYYFNTSGGPFYVSLEYLKNYSIFSNGVVYIETIVYKKLYIHYPGSVNKSFTDIEINPLTTWPVYEYDNTNYVAMYYTSSSFTTKITFTSMKADLALANVNVYVRLEEYGSISYILNSNVVLTGKLNDSSYPTSFNVNIHYTPSKFYREVTLSNEFKTFESLRNYYASDLTQDVVVYCTGTPIPYYNSTTLSVQKNASSIFNLSYIVAQLNKNFTDPDNSLLVFEKTVDNYSGFGNVPGTYSIVLKAQNSFGSFIEQSINIDVVDNLGVDCIIGNSIYVDTSRNMSKEEFITVLKARGIAPNENISCTFTGVGDYFLSPGTADTYEQTITWVSPSENNGSFEYKIVCLSKPVYDVVVTDISLKWYEYAIGIGIVIGVVYLISRLFSKKKKARW